MKTLFEMSIAFVLAILFIGCFYFMFLFFYVGFSLPDGTCWNMKTGAVRDCSTGEIVGHLPAAIWHELEPGEDL